MNIDTKVYRKHENPTFGNTLLGAVLFTNSNKMNTHYRNYQILVNGNPLPFFHSVEAISTDYIEKSKQNCINEQKKMVE